jgi:orotidine-5'-phosphate decarboxylase
MDNFADRLAKRILETSCITVGLDPDFHLMPSKFLPKKDSLSAVKEELINFSCQVIDAVFDLVPAIKIQAAFFERFGVVGFEALEEILKYAKQKNLITIFDCKRGDIGSTSKAYADAYLGGSLELDGIGSFRSNLEFDSITVNPFLGLDTLEPFIDILKKSPKGIFVLVKTSNQGSHLIQDQVLEDHHSVSELLAVKINELADKLVGQCGYSSIGVVVGATYPEEASRLRTLLPRSMFLIPGLGSQGGSISNVINNLDHLGLGALISASRAITYPDHRAIAKKGYQAAVRDITASYIEELKILLKNKKIE